MLQGATARGASMDITGKHTHIMQHDMVCFVLVFMPAPYAGASSGICLLYYLFGISLVYLFTY